VGGGVEIECHPRSRIVLFSDHDACPSSDTERAPSVPLQVAPVVPLQMTEREKRAGTAEATARSSEESTASSKEKSPSPRKSLGQMRMDSMTFKKYPGQQQVVLSVEIDVPGSWFTASALGGLTTAEKKEKYRAMCVEYEDRHVFEPEDKKKRKPARVGAAVRFVCPADAADDADHPGFWIELDKWNRYRNDTYKDNRDAEVCLSAARTKLLPVPALGSQLLAFGSLLALTVACLHLAVCFRRTHTSLPVSWLKLPRWKRPGSSHPRLSRRSRA
jgi:hypothetical protein